MKLFSRISILVFIIVGLSIHAKEMRSGNEGAYGGDSYGGEFTSLANEIFKELVLSANAALVAEHKIDLDEFRRRLAATVRSGESKEVTLEVMREGKIYFDEVDAINIPDDNYIKINRTRWRKKQLFVKLKDVLHEVFGLMNVERNHWGVSSNFEEMLRRLSFHILAKRGNLVRYYGYAVSNPPILFKGDPCSAEQSFMAAVMAAAKAQAVSACEDEQRRSCIVRMAQVNTSMDPKIFGVIKCEVDTIAAVVN